MRRITDPLCYLGCYALFGFYFLFLLIAINILWHVKRNMVPGRAPTFDPKGMRG